MKQRILIYLLIFFTKSGYCQVKNNGDATSVLETDIYSNFSKETYRRYRPNVIQISIQGKDSTLKKFNYDESIKRGDVFYKKGDFRSAANIYKETFLYNRDLGKIDDRFKLACCYVNLNKVDSVFSQLQRIATKGRYTSIEELKTKNCFKSLHSDKRWLDLIAQINKNREDLLIEMNKKINTNE
jgi:lipopolysaccharide biosynthesis regulator YciM